MLVLTTGGQGITVNKFHYNWSRLLLTPPTIIILIAITNGYNPAPDSGDVTKGGSCEGLTSLTPVHELERPAEDTKLLANPSCTSPQFWCQRTDLTSNPTWDLRNRSPYPFPAPPFPSHTHRPLHYNYCHSLISICPFGALDRLTRWVTRRPNFPSMGRGFCARTSTRFNVNPRKEYSQVIPFDCSHLQSLGRVIRAFESCRYPSASGSRVKRRGSVQLTTLAPTIPPTTQQVRLRGYFLTSNLEDNGYGSDC